MKIRANSVLASISLLLLAAAIFSFSSAGYIALKANIAQYLLNKSWLDNSASTHLKSKPWPWADIYPVAKLTFERLDIAQIVVNNDSGQALAFAPGFNDFYEIHDNKMFADVFVISAHNDTHFSVLESLRLNDKVTLTFKSGYAQQLTVKEISVIDTKEESLVVEGEQSVFDENDNKEQYVQELVLVTCYPFSGGNTQNSLRYIVKLT